MSCMVLNILTEYPIVLLSGYVKQELVQTELSHLGIVQVPYLWPALPVFEVANTM